MAKSKRTGASIKAYYKNYANGNKWSEHAEVILERHIKNQPNDSTAIQALNRLKAGTKAYCRNRKSSSNICKVVPNIAIATSRGDDRLTIIQQMQNIGFTYRGRRNTKTTR